MRNILPIGVVAALALVPAAAASAAKPGPAAVAGHPGVAMLDNHAQLKGAAPAGLSSLLGDKSPAGGASTDVNGYTVVNSGTLSNPNGAQSYGQVNCPTGKVAFSGGVFGGSTSVNQDINGSIPVVAGGLATGWGAYIDNASGADSTFSVWAVCAKKPKNYAVVSLGFTNSAGTQNSQTVSCPLASTGKPMKVLGGGGIGGSTGLLQNLNTTIPSGKSAWRMDINNAGAFDASAATYAVCGGAKGWASVQGTAVSNPAGAQTPAYATCALGKTIIGGGVFSSSGSTSVNLNATWPDTATSWGVFENNASGSAASITPYGVCAL
jgi:hypothetical protein